MLQHETEQEIRNGELRSIRTGCTGGFSGAENCKENAMKTRNFITKFSALKSVIKLKLFCI